MWPTPNVPNGGRSPATGTMSRTGMTPDGKKRQVDLGQAVKRWPTPQAHDTAKGNAARVGRYGTKHGGRNLNDEVAMWPTPKGSPEHYGQPRENDRGDLQAAVFRTPQARDGDERGPSSPERRKKQGHSVSLHDQVGGQLNADWVSLLMGFPETWTVVDGSAECPER